MAVVWSVDVVCAGSAGASVCVFGAVHIAGLVAGAASGAVAAAVTAIVGAEIARPPPPLEERYRTLEWLTLKYKCTLGMPTSPLDKRLS